MQEKEKGKASLDEEKRALREEMSALDKEVEQRKKSLVHKPTYNLHSNSIQLEQRFGESQRKSRIRHSGSETQ